MPRSIGVRHLHYMSRLKSHTNGTEKRFQEPRHHISSFLPANAVDFYRIWWNNQSWLAVPCSNHKSKIIIPRSIYFHNLLANTFAMDWNGSWTLFPRRLLGKGKEGKGKLRFACTTQWLRGTQGSRELQSASHAADMQGLSWDWSYTAAAAETSNRDLGTTVVLFLADCS